MDENFSALMAAFRPAHVRYMQCMCEYKIAGNTVWDLRNSSELICSHFRPARQTCAACGTCATIHFVFAVIWTLLVPN